MGNAMAGALDKGGQSSAPVACHRHADAGEQHKGPVERPHGHRSGQTTVETSLYDGLRHVDVDNGDDVVTGGAPASGRSLRFDRGLRTAPDHSGRLRRPHSRRCHKS